MHFLAEDDRIKKYNSLSTEEEEYGAIGNDAGGYCQLCHPSV